MWKFLSIPVLTAALLAAGFAQADTEGLRFEGEFSAAQEVPAVTSPGEGRIRTNFADDLSKVVVEVRVKRLTSPVSMAHLHCAPAGKSGPVILDLKPRTGKTSGRIVRARFNNGDLADINCVPECGIDITNIAALRFAADQGCIYANVHPDAFPPGEVRAQLLAREDGGKRRGKGRK